jgi:hypothetical protein
MKGNNLGNLKERKQKKRKKKKDWRAIFFTFTRGGECNLRRLEYNNIYKKK